MGNLPIAFRVTPWNSGEFATASDAAKTLSALPTQQAKFGQGDTERTGNANQGVASHVSTARDQCNERGHGTKA